MGEKYSDVVELMTSVGYDGDLQKHDAFSEAVEEGLKSNKFRQLVAWITDEIRILGNVEEKVHGDGDVNDFMLELSAFLKDMICPFTKFISGPVSERIQTIDSRLLLLDYLLSELMAMRMCHKLKPKEDVVIEISETPAAAALKTMTICLNMGKPPENIAPKMLFDKINSRIDEILQKLPKNTIGNPLFTPSKPLTKEQWTKLEKYQQELDDEYNLRRQMLLTRLDVTIQSFQWSDRMKGKGDKIAARYSAKRKELDDLQIGDKSTDLIALLAAREELAIIEKTSSANVRKNTHATIHRHVIGKVPDRGGRAYEHAPPPPEMPSWQQNRSTGGGGGGGGGQRGGGAGGGRGGNFGGNQQNNRGGFQQQQQQQQQGFPAQHGGYWQSGGGNNYQPQGGGGGGGGYDNRSGGFDNRSGGLDNRSGGFDNRSGGLDNRSGGFDNRSGGFDNRGGGFDNRGGGYDNQRGSSGGGGGGYDSQRGSSGGGGGRVQGGWSQGGFKDSRGAYTDRSDNRGGSGGSYGNQRQHSNPFDKKGPSNPFDQPFNSNEFYGRRGNRR